MTAVAELTSRLTGHGDGDVRGDSHDQENGYDAGQYHDPKITGATIGQVYDSYADSYEDGAEETRQRTFQRDVFNRFPHHGFTLDLGCGTGGAGMLIRQSPLNSSSASGNVGGPGDASTRPNVYVHGVDVSARMLNRPWCVRYYDSTQRGLIQDVLMDPDAAWLQHAVRTGAAESGGLSAGPVVDHITCFGALHFLDPSQFEAVLSRVFVLARRSVMFDIDDFCPFYMQHVLENLGEGFRNYNHMAAYRKFGTPPGWAKVAEEEAVLYRMENCGVDVRGVLVRFERVD
ncbi:uncharacterized protein B0H64DRAFT_142509 [Chaetomium fimeti]|uniref:Methyltransferase domain-containing protein n=1 Tax=Chaetomium fimeti TaxID=1854472 RepID=A0AAE0HF87_9PEZI|nr:hypothetical protein B0H64DRAFT_142509 [Chaetomium fimeti]